MNTNTAPPWEPDKLDLLILDKLKASDLSEEQQSLAREVIETKNNFLITGNAGVGKTHVLNWLRLNIGMSVTASTGIAAIQIKGSTIHSWAGLGIGKQSAPKIVDSLAEKALKYRDRTLERIRHCQRLVIDEVSMLDADMLDLLEQVLMIARESEESFGGVQMVFIGDFLQLPPVSRKGAAKFAFNADSWEGADVQVRLLTKVFRQEDEEFSSILNKIRFGDTDDEVFEFLKARHKAVDDDPEHPPCILHSHNAGCEEKNLLELEKLPGEEWVVESQEWSKHENFAKQLDKECLAPRNLHLKQGARVMLLTNLDLAKGLANGSLGIVNDEDPEDLRYPEDPGDPEVVRVDFDNGHSVEIETVEYELIKGDSVLATRKQLPLRLAWAITIHKSQGMTIPKVEAHLAKCFAKGQSYVALSRAKTAEGLFLRGGGANIEAHPKAVRFYQEHCS